MDPSEHTPKADRLRARPNITKGRHRKRKKKVRRRSKRHLIKLMIILLSFGVIGGVIYLITVSTPGRVEYKKADQQGPKLDAGAQQELAFLLDRSHSLEEQFLQTTRTREITDDDLMILREAIRYKSDFVKRAPGDQTEINNELTQMITRLQDYEAQKILDKSRDMENEGNSLRLKDQYEEAMNAFREARALQIEINDTFPLSRAKDLTRVNRLERTIDQLKAEPVYKRSVDLENESRRAADMKSWDEARTALAEAISLQSQINKDFRDTKYADLQRLKNMQMEMSSFSSVESYNEIEEIVSKAVSMLNKDDEGQAAELYTQAAELQLQLNNDYPQSRFASELRYSQFIRASQNAKSVPLANAIKQELDNMVSNQRRGDLYDFQKAVEPLYEKVMSFIEQYPSSDQIPENLGSDIELLHSLGDQLPELYEQINQSLIRIPDYKSYYLYTTEIPQSLYKLIMQTNPSRTKGDDLPVESVTWEEAATFAYKVGLILGHKTRLPTEDEFRAALGDATKQDKESSWNIETTDGSMMPVGSSKPNSFGYYDLIGNAQEWVSSGGNAVIWIGGSYRDSHDRLLALYADESQKNERSRLSGFRILVEK